ncbi:bifunctional metallophosphatase/5'-nucleotidase [Chryseobacterium sp. A301]
MQRKEFLKLSGKAALALSVAPHLLQAKSPADLFQPSEKRLTILHTNDQHSRIEPFDQTGGRNAGKGGFARRAALIQKIRAEQAQVLVLDSGDIFQGTPYFNLFGGELEFKLMSMMGYDASTMGNHDFDNGLDGFLKVLPNAKFPFLCSNYDFSDTILEGRTTPYQVFNKGGIRVGVFGLGIELEGLVGKKQYAETRYLDPIEMANHYSAVLRKEKKCDLVVCLSHLGFDYGEKPKVSDVVLAQKTSGIDLILGGHTHTFFERPKEYQNLENQKVLVNQVGFAGLLLGRLDFIFDTKNKIKSIASNVIPIDHTSDSILG